MSKRNQGVRVWEERMAIPTYVPSAPDPNPMFLEKRVYQGSSGCVYPLPFTDRVAEEKSPKQWRAIWLENEFLRVMILPEIGGRIHRAQDKTNGYDFIYHQQVIKPALVGLAGPWISGGIEFNWPQHHRPSTFMPADAVVEKHPDGSVTVWLSEHDPMARMKGMHGVCLYPDRSCVELKVRVFNRTDQVQTFLWWANVAARVHEGYQSFFPPDVFYVADHAKRATSSYPLCRETYYGIDFGSRVKGGVPPQERPTQFIPAHLNLPSANATDRADRAPAPGPIYAPNDLSWYANIPTPCSYMCMGSKEDFFGGYDHLKQAGLIHVADHHISPGKKQWTWGNHGFGYAWDRNLTDEDGPYIELMAGVYTDNQPDFSFLHPGETRTWSQHWYPIRVIGPAQHANLEAAISLRMLSATAKGQPGQWAAMGVSVTRPHRKASLELTAARASRPARRLGRFVCDLAPGQPFTRTVKLPAGTAETDLALTLRDHGGREIISYSPQPRAEREVPPPATEPSSPAEVASADELYLVGLHLEQYRHATRCPTSYWREALRRDPLDARCNTALGRWHLRRGEFAQARVYLQRAVQRLTQRNPNPYDGEALYQLGLCERHLGHDDAAYDALYKATWNDAWQAAAFHVLAEIDCRRRDWDKALEHLSLALRKNVENLRARALKSIVLRRLGRDGEALDLLRANLVADPLDWWSRYLLGDPLGCDTQTALDLALDFARAGLFAEAIELLSVRAEELDQSPKTAPPSADPRELGVAPLVHYYLGWLRLKAGQTKSASATFRRAAAQPKDYCFPARLEEIAILEAAIEVHPDDARAPYYLGNLLYDRRRHEEAIGLWARSVKLEPGNSVAWRNLGIGCFNIRRQPTKARAAYAKAFAANPHDARLLYERDQLWKRLGTAPDRRRRELERYEDLTQRRDDLSLELCALYNQTGQASRALALLQARKFQPWEGGEGVALNQHVRARLSLGRQAFSRRRWSEAKAHFVAALSSPENLGEAKHVLVNQSDIHYWIGRACDALGETAQAREHWRAAATFRGDFQDMSVRRFSEMTYYSALAWGCLRQSARMRRLLGELLSYAKELGRAPAVIDYFATSLPTMLLFDDDLQRRQETTALFLQAQAHAGLGRKRRADQLLRQVLQRDPNHALAADLAQELRAAGAPRHTR